jgi:c-di-GMP-binding flagellar brake protein YcgR
MQAEPSEDPTGYTLHGRGEIIEKFRLMQRKRCLVTAHHPDSKANLVTAIVEVLPDKELVVFDVGVSDALNRRFADAGRVVFTAQVEGVKSRFAVEKLTEALLRGQPVFAAPIPDALFWQQQRKFYRVAIPLSLPVKCAVPLEGKRVEFGVYDLSISGLALVDKSCRFGDGFEAGLALEGCALSIPGHSEILTTLEIRNKLPLNRAHPPAGQRVGCAFQGLPRGAEIALQKFIFEVELMKKRQETLLRE